MGILDTMFGLERVAGQPAPDDDYWYRAFGTGTSTAGVRINENTMLRCSAVLACVKVLSETIAALPYPVYRRLPGDRGKERYPNHPLYDLLQYRPNDEQTAFEYRQLKVVMTALYGNWFARILPGARGAVDRLQPLHPDRVVVERLPTGRLRYRYRDPEGPEVVLTQDQVQHVRGLSLDGVMGVDTMDIARDVVGLALGAEAYAARLFANDARPRGILTTEGKMDADMAKALEQSWQNAYGPGGNQHATALLYGGMKYQPVSSNPEQVQMVDARTAQALEVARVFRMQPHKIGILDRATFSNIEQQSIEFVVDTVMPWLIRFEQADMRDLITAPQQYFVEHVVEGLLRGDSKARSEFYQSAIQNGWMTRNEVRRLENLNPLSGLDAPLEPQNMAPAGSKPPQGRNNGRAQLRRLVEAAAERVVRKEVNAMATEARRHADSEGEWAARVQAFYTEHAAFITEALPGLVDARTATEWAEGQTAELLREGPAVLEAWRQDKPAQLANLALGDGALIDAA